MKILIKFLIWSIKTIDGKKDTASSCLEKLNNLKVEQFKKHCKFCPPLDQII